MKKDLFPKSRQKNLVVQELDSEALISDLQNVELALDQLKKEKLIENGVEITNQFEGISHREVVKKIELFSLVTIPIVASLVAREFRIMCQSRFFFISKKYRLVF